MKKLAKGLEVIYRYLLYILPVALVFSYHPVITIGSDEAMNFELSLTLIWLVIFGIVSIALFLMNIKKIRKKYKKLNKKFYLVFALPILMSLSVIWSENVVRGILTIGVMWLVVIAMLSVIFMAKVILSEKARFKEVLCKILEVTVLAVCAWCFLQCIMDVFGVGREVTLLCAGCTTESFGFPHPNGFTIEPQFMGNLLILPALYGVYYFIEKKPKFFSIRTLEIMFVLATLFLTFSRGAIYAFVVALVFMVVFTMIREKAMRPLFVLVPTMVAFLFTLNVQGVFAAVSKTNDTYISGVAKVISQLSLGVVDFTEEVKPKVENVEVNREVGSEASNEAAGDNMAQESTFDGYVEESTNTRLNLNTVAFEVWQKDAKTMLIGVGIGGAGTALYENGKSVAKKEIVQNEYVSLLLETGIIGVICLVITVIVIIYGVRAGLVYPERMLFYAVFIAYGLTLMFFSGLPNALHIYLLPSLGYLMVVMKKKVV